MLKLTLNKTVLTIRYYSLHHFTFYRLKVNYLHKSILASCVHSRFYWNQCRYVHCSSSNVNKIGLSFKGNESPELQLDEETKSVLTKVWFNSVREKYFPRLAYRFTGRLSYYKKFEERKRHELNSLKPNIPLAAKYLQRIDNGDHGLEEEAESNKSAIVVEEEAHFPYSNYSKTFEPYGASQNVTTDDNSTVNEVDINSRAALSSKNLRVQDRIDKWMADYEKFNDIKLEDGSMLSSSNCGTPNKYIPVSSVPCGGCGAYLHCQDPGLPGYLPSELFCLHKPKELQTITCQRCHFLRHFNLCLDVNVSPDEYPRLLSEIRYRRAYVILMVDLTDFPCSIWPGLFDIIGPSRPIVVVGNKADLIPRDTRGYIRYIEKCLRRAVESAGVQSANIKHVCLISARTGYGVERLITKLYNLFEYKNDVFLVGCTNVGKSTLFNALLASDYCRIKARDLVQRATTAPWPGTTMNLLKFPIMRPTGWKLALRTERLKRPGSGYFIEKELEEMQYNTSLRVNLSLQSSIDTTLEKRRKMKTLDVFHLDRSHPRVTVGIEPRGLDLEDPELKNARWFYDTPGAVSPDQILSMLTTKELLMIMPREVIVPRTFSVQPRCSLFIAGLARLDYSQGQETIMVTVFASSELPVTVCRTQDADEIYTSLIGSQFLVVPVGHKKRLEKWPGLQPNERNFDLTGISWLESCGDIVLSSAGWVSITARKNEDCTFKAWTPEARGIYLRKPSLLPNAVNARGKRVRRSPEYEVISVKNEDEENEREEEEGLKFY